MMCDDLRKGNVYETDKQKTIMTGISTKTCFKTNELYGYNNGIFCHDKNV